jgi:hypothetical protein
MVNTNMAPERIANCKRPTSLRGPNPATSRKLQATSSKPQATSCDNLSLDIMINKGYSYIRAARELVSIRSGISHAKRASREKQAAAPNKRRKQWQNSRLSSMMQNLKSRILSTNTASHLPGWKQRTITSICLRELGSVLQMAVQRIPGSGIAVTSSINMLAPSWGLATSHLLRAASRKPQASSNKPQATSV